EQTGPRVATNPAGGFVVAWGSSDAGKTLSTVRLQRFAPGGAAIGGEQIAGSSTFATTFPALAVAPDSSIAVAWGARREVPRRYPVVLQRYDAGGQVLGPLLTSSEVNDFGNDEPDVAFGPARDFLVVWRGDDGSELSVQARRYDAAGNVIGPPLLVFVLDLGSALPRGPPPAARGRGFLATRSGAGRPRPRRRPRVPPAHHLRGSDAARRLRARDAARQHRRGSRHRRCRFGHAAGRVGAGRPHPRATHHRRRPRPPTVLRHQQLRRCD